MTAYEKTHRIHDRLTRRGASLPFDAVNALRRAEITLQRWAEAECGTSNDAGSYSIERDEETGRPYRHFYGNSGSHFKSAIPDRERGALRRIAAICAEFGLHYFHQTDPRGCALYVSTEPLTDQTYTNGIAVCA